MRVFFFFFFFVTFNFRLCNFLEFQAFKSLHLRRRSALAHRNCVAFLHTADTVHHGQWWSAAAAGKAARYEDFKVASLQRCAALYLRHPVPSVRLLAAPIFSFALISYLAYIYIACRCVHWEVKFDSSKRVRGLCLPSLVCPRDDDDVTTWALQETGFVGSVYCMGESAAWTWQRCVSHSLSRTHTSQMPFERMDVFCTGILSSSISVLFFSFFRTSWWGQECLFSSQVSSLSPTQWLWYFTLYNHYRKCSFKIIQNVSLANICKFYICVIFFSFFLTSRRGLGKAV